MKYIGFHLRKMGINPKTGSKFVLAGSK